MDSGVYCPRKCAKYQGILLNALINLARRACRKVAVGTGGPDDKSLDECGCPALGLGGRDR